MRQLIINADDFGMSFEVNEGIKRCIDARVVNSVSLMVNMPYFTDAVAYLKRHPEVSVGLHFNITEGKPIGKPKNRSTLIREDNSFFHWGLLTPKLFLNSCSFDEIQDVLKTQYEKLEKTGLPISHIDSHHHIHLYPSIYKIVLDYARMKKIRSLRSRSFVSPTLLAKLQTGMSLKQILIIALCYINDLLFSQINHEIVPIRSIYDMTWDRRLTANKFDTVLAHLGNGITEIICHPAILSSDGNPRFLKPRNIILSILLNPTFKKSLKRYHITMFNRIASVKRT